MSNIFELKEQAVTDTPLLLFDCTLADGRVERWSTHRATVGQSTYEARVLQHNIFEMPTASDQGVDGIPRITIVLANAGSHFSELERATGWKGARLKVTFLFYDLRSAAPASESVVLFQGTCDPPDEIREATFRLTATNRMNLQRCLLPQVRIQRRCPWEFPSTDAQRREAVNGGSQGKYSRFYRCGYSAGVEGGEGSLDHGSPFTSCGYTRADCEARGMFAHFGGIEFVPPVISVRTAGDKEWHSSALAVNAARYNDFVPLVYGTAWYSAPVVFARNDGNLTRMEALLGIGEMQGVLKVLVNDVEIPLAFAGTNMTGTGWYNVPTLGTRAGNRNGDFLDGNGQPAGDPYGSMAYLSVVVPNRLNDGTSLPRVKVLAQGVKVPVYDSAGTLSGVSFSSNPAWILLDTLRRTGWSESEIEIPSFAQAAAYCDEEIDSRDVYGNPIRLPRFQCNMALQSRRSAGEVVRGVRTCGRLLLTYGANGALRVVVENTLAAQQPVKPAWSNSTQPLNGGWPSYEFGDGADGAAAILRRADGAPSVRVFSRSIADTPNRFAVEFQDALNGYQQDSYSVVDADDVGTSGQEVAGTLHALGLPHYDQAARILKLHLDKSVRGNTYLEFDTSVKGFGVRPGDLIAVTYLKEGFQRQPFRVLKIAPGANHRVSRITAQIHDDRWYADGNGQPGSASDPGRRDGAGVGTPRPLVGALVDQYGEIQFSVEESAADGSDGSIETSLTVGCIPPAQGGGPGPGIPLVGLMPTVEPGGALESGQMLYYAISASDSAGNEGSLSFIIRAAIAADGSRVTLTGLRFAPGTAAFNVYRGSAPGQLFRVASARPPAPSFCDTGLPEQLSAPPDANFDHANFYWRQERQPEYAATIHSGNTIGNSALDLGDNCYRGMIARITRGRGAGQERSITANTQTTLSVAPVWAIEPDSSSQFVVAESAWHFGAQTRTERARFAVPNRSGEVTHITGRSANVNDVECAPELCAVTRWQIGGAGGADTSVPQQPFFGLGPGKRGGTVELSGISFPDLTNTRTTLAATLTLFYWDELRGVPSVSLSQNLAADGDLVELTAQGSADEGTLLQIESEVLRVTEVLDNGARYRVSRGAHGSEAAAHSAQSLIYDLERKTTIAPFPRDFFGSPYSGNWADAITIPDVRIACAELFVTNQKGNSPAQSVCLTHTADRGLRTLSGGQYTIQAAGFLAVEQSVAPALVVEASHAVRDVFAVLGTAADAPVTIRLNADASSFCEMSFSAGSVLSNSVDGNALPPLSAGSKLTLSILTTGQTHPGADLTVIIRL